MEYVTIILGLIAAGVAIWQGVSGSNETTRAQNEGLQVANINRQATLKQNKINNNLQQKDIAINQQSLNFGEYALNQKQRQLDEAKATKQTDNQRQTNLGLNSGTNDYLNARVSSINRWSL